MKKFLLIALLVLLPLRVFAAVIQSGAGTDQLTVDPTSKAGRMTPYDGAGNSLLPSELARGLASIVVRQSAATAAGATVWAIHNPSSTRTVTVKACQLQLFFDGTAAATLAKYELVKATGVTTFSGGVVVTPVIKKTSLGSPSAVVRVLDTGLTTTGATFGGLGHIIAQGRVTQTTTIFSSTLTTIDFRALQSGEIELAQNELLAIRNNATSVVGDNIIGYCEFSEK